MLHRASQVMSERKIFVPESNGKAHVPQWLEPLRPREQDSVDNKEVFDLILSVDWSTKDATLAHIDSWPYSLRTMVQMILATDTPHCILWGDNLVCIYNAAYWRHIALSKHPELMGMAAREAFQKNSTEDQTWDPYKNIMAALKSQRPVSVPETVWLREVEPHSHVAEEIYTSYKISTIYGDDSSSSGLLCVYFESTIEVLNSRKARTLRSMLAATQESSTFNALKLKLTAAFEDCALDFPICLLMLDKTFLSGDWSSNGESGDQVEYRTFVQVGMKNVMSARFVDFEEALKAGAADSDRPMFAELATRAHQSQSPYNFTTERLKNHCAKRAFGRSCERGRMYPIYAEDEAADLTLKPLAYLMLTFSPVRPLDDFLNDYADTVEDLIKTALRNFREVSRSKARLDEMNAIKKHGEQYFRVLNDSPVGICVQDWSSKNLIFSNKRWMQIMGYEEDHTLDEWTDLIYPDDLPAIYRILADMQPDMPSIEHMHRIKRLHTNGKPAWLTVNCSFHREQMSNDQVVTFMTTAIHDTSEQVYAKETEMASLIENQRLNAAREMEAQRADAADSAKARQLEYVDTLAHEIRNPISAIVQTVELLIDRLKDVQIKDQDIDAELQQSIDDLETIDICTSHMGRVINDTLNISKLEHGSLEIKLEPCDLVPHVQSVLRMLMQDMRNKGITCPALTIEPDALKSFSHALTDPLRYKQVILNLMTNAIKFTALAEGKKEIVMTLSTKKSEGDAKDRLLVCTVRDTGAGMSAEALQKLFGKFYQVSDRTHIEYGGSGLGLFISQRLAALLGGKIEVVSELGKGSEFAFIIPAHISVDPTKAAIRDEARTPDCTLSLTEMEALGHRHSISAQLGRRSRQVSPHPSANGSAGRSRTTNPEQKPDIEQKTILVVEDNLVNQKLMVKQLSMSGYRVLVGNHGLEALDHFKNGEYIDLVVTDIEMPIMNGMQTIAAVRALDPSIVKNQPPFIACSAYAREEQKQAFIDAGMIGVLAKPHKFAELKKCVENVLMQRLPFRREYSL